MPRGPEQERLDRLTGALERFGWLWTHFRPGYTSRGYRTPLSGRKGFPDLVCVHRGRGLLLFCEVKSDKGKLSPDQKEWREALEAAGSSAHSRCEFYAVCDSDESEANLLDLISDGRLTARR